MRILLIIFSLSLLVGCATNIPRNKSNACHLLVEKDQWQSVVYRAANKWNIPAHTILAIIYHESKFVPDAAPPRRPASEFGFLGRRISSAYGYAQALDGTWEEYKNRTGNFDAVRYDFSDSVDFIGWYLNRSVKSLNISRRNAYHLYLAYHQGDYGFRRGSYKRKPAIMRYARKVQRTAVKYMYQLNSCQGRLAYR